MHLIYKEEAVQTLALNYAYAAADLISEMGPIDPETLPVVQELRKQLDVVMKNLSLVCEMCKHNEDCMKNHNSCTGFSDFEPKVREGVQGSWEWFEEEYGIPVLPWDRDWGWRCSHCKNTLDDEYDDPDRPPKFKFCSNCGARMVRSK